MAAKFKPLSLALVDEGRFSTDIDEEITAAMKALIKYKRKYGAAKVGKAKAVVTVKLIIAFEGRDESDFSIKGTIAQTVPSKPPCVTVAIENEEDDGEPALFVRASGSTHDTPAQAVLATKDGKLVDVATGEIKG